jgi:hypothetical protein
MLKFEKIFRKKYLKKFFRGLIDPFIIFLGILAFLVFKSIISYAIFGGIILWIFIKYFIYPSERFLNSIYEDTYEYYSFRKTEYELRNAFDKLLDFFKVFNIRFFSKKEEFYVRELKEVFDKSLTLVRNILSIEYKTKIFGNENLKNELNNKKNELIEVYKQALDVLEKFCGKVIIKQIETSDINFKTSSDFSQQLEIIKKVNERMSKLEGEINNLGDERIAE